MNMGIPLISIIPSNDSWYESTTWLNEDTVLRIRISQCIAFKVFSYNHIEFKHRIGQLRGLNLCWINTQIICQVRAKGPEISFVARAVQMSLSPLLFGGTTLG